jgi:signal transduction histidine kinase
MEKDYYTSINLYTGTDLAFALVVFIAFFSAFSSSPVTSLFLILIIIVLGTAYISNGIYGFSYVRKSNNSIAKLIYFLSQFLIGGLIIYYGRGAGIFTLILLPIVAHSVIALDENWSLITNIGILLTFFVSVWGYSLDLVEVWQRFPLFFTGQVFVLIFTQMAVTEQKARKRLQNLAEELSDANQHLSEYATQVKELTVTQERNRFAREIHDGLGHYLTTINMQINAANALIKKEPLKALEILEKAKRLTSEALVDVRDSVYALREESMNLEDLPARISGLVDSARTPGWEIFLNVKGDPYPLVPPAQLTIYRAAQETINNAKKHSRGSVIDLEMDYSEREKFQFVSRDNGKGAGVVATGYGILGIKERVRLLNGEVVIENHPGEGFMVKIELPVKNDD